MSSGSDSEGSVQVVEDGSKGKVSACEPRASAPSATGNFCLERDGVRLRRPASKGVVRSSSSVDRTSGLAAPYRTKRTENEGEPWRPLHKRSRAPQPVERNTDLDVVEVEETVEAVPRSQGRACGTSNHYRRHSARLMEKKASEKASLMEFNMKVLKQDRTKRESNRHRPSLDSIQVLDDEEEKRQSLSSKLGNDSIEQAEHRKGDRIAQPKSPQASEQLDEIVPVEEEDQKHAEENEEEHEENLNAQPKDSRGVDAPYTGSTHLIFEFPPGERGKIGVTEEERGRLSQRKYLNDSLIDFYIKYHESDLERRAENLRLSATFFSSFFFGRLRRTDPIDYEGVKGWTKKVDIFTKQFVFVPICDSYHWSLIIVANLNKVKALVDCKEEFSQSSTEAPRIIYLDSLDPKRGTEFGETMRQYLVEEWLAKKLRIETNTAARKATTSTFKKLIPILRPNVPIQTNEYDCGLYLLNSFEMFLYNTDGLRDKLLSGYRDVRDAYSHVDITMLRKSIINLMDILESQWIREQFPTERESSERGTEHVMENAIDGTGIYISKSLHERVDGVHKHADGDRGKITMLDQKATESEENRGCASHLVSTDSPEHVSLLEAGDFPNKQPEKIERRDENLNLERSSNLDDVNKQPINSDSNTHLNSNLPSAADPPSPVATGRRGDYVLDHTNVRESRKRTREESLTHYYPVGPQEVSVHLHDEELRREANDGHESESELLEVAVQNSSGTNPQLIHDGFDSG